MAHKYVCKIHFTDKYIRKFIVENAVKDVCNYCKRSKKVVLVKDLAEYLEETVRHEFIDPYEYGAPYDPEGAYYEDRFPGVSVVDTLYVLEMELEIEADPWAILEDLSQEFNNDYWSEIDGIFGPTLAGYLRGGWNEFRNVIKHKVRFVFFNKVLEDDFKDKDREYLNPYLALEEVKKSIDELNLYTHFNISELIAYRGRQHVLSEDVSAASHLGSPPLRFAKANRMSPPGIPMFYGALNEVTSRMEIESIDSSKPRITIGKFTNLRPLTFVDFTKLKEIPSLFDEGRRKTRARAKFLEAFIEDLSIPVQPDDSVHIDYIPTQVVTEYIKLILGKERNVDGIFYNSVKDPGGVCLVMFLENHDACDEHPVVPPVVEFEKLFGTVGAVQDADPKDWATLIMDNQNLTRINL